MSRQFNYLPAVIRSEHDAALDALLALDLPRDEAMDLLVAAWPQDGLAIVAAGDGGRPVAAVPLANGRWAACNVFSAYLAGTPDEARRHLRRLAKRGRRGVVACVPAAAS